jgi:Fe-Mn family superoxide dismutase
MLHNLPALPYSYNAFSPILSEETMHFHHDLHHKAYYTNLNSLLEKPEYEAFRSMSLEDIVKKAPQGGLFNNAGQAWNHDFYWQCLTPVAQFQRCPNDLESALTEQFGSLEAFKKQFISFAIAQFGSGWAWLVKDQQGNLNIETTSNAETPLKTGKTCLLTCDVWEHAYYIDYRNRRPDYLSAFWEIVNWKFVHDQFIAVA